MFSDSEDESFSVTGGAALDLERTPRRLFLLTGLAVIGGFLFGYDTGVVSGAFLLVRREMNLTDAWHELLVSGTVGAAFITSLSAGSISDRIGRRPSILIASVLFGLGSVVMAIAVGKVSLLVGRLLVGVAVGLASTVVPLYLGECSTCELRGVLVAINIAAVTFGQLVAGICCGLLMDFTGGWRAMLGLALVPSVVQLLGFYFMPETPRYLVKIGKFSEAESVLSSIRSPFHQIQDELEDIRISVNNSQESVNFVTFLRNFVHDRHARRSVFLGCLLQFCQQFAGINTVMYYAASIIKMTGSSDKLAIWYSCVTAAVNFVFSLLGLKLVHKLSRRKLLLGSLCCVVISLLCISVSFKSIENKHTNHTTRFIKRETTELAKSYDFHNFLPEHGVNTTDNPVVSADIASESEEIKYSTEHQQVDQDVHDTITTVEVDTSEESSATTIATTATTAKADTESLQPEENKNTVVESMMSQQEGVVMVLISMVMYIAAFAPGLGPLPWTINSEIHPTWCRAQAQSVSSCTNWISNLVVSVTFLTLTSSLGRSMTFLLYALVTALCAAILAKWLPESKGVSLENVGVLFSPAASTPKSGDVAYSPMNMREL